MDDARREFEEGMRWFHDGVVNLRRHGTTYIDTAVAFQWRLWQCAWAHAHNDGVAAERERAARAVKEASVTWGDDEETADVIERLLDTLAEAIKEG